jgi:HEAT repeat protein
MDDSEHRKQYAERLKHVTERRERDRNVFLDRTKPVEERRLALQSTELRDQDEIAEATDIVLAKDADVDLRVAAVHALDIEVGKRHDMIDLMIGRLTDDAEPSAVRLAALQVLQQSTFSAATFNPKRPEYLAALRTVIGDPDVSLREQALEILAQEKDEYAQRRLLESLKYPSQALVPPEKAIQLLGYDIHAEHYPILRKTVQDPPSPEAKREAVRMLGSDPVSKELLTGILMDKNERREVRNASASALQSLAPGEFEERAREIAFAQDEYPDIRATAINALTLFADQDALDQDAELVGRVEQLREEAPSDEVERSAERFLRRRRRRRARRNRSGGERG